MSRKIMSREEIERDNQRVASKPVAGAQSEMPALPPPAAPEKSTRIGALLARKLNWSNAASIPVTEPRPKCRTCGGMGFYTPDVEITDPRFGKAVACPEPDCPGVARNRRMRAANFDEKLRKHFGAKDAVQYHPDARMSHFDRHMPGKMHAIEAVRLYLKHGEIEMDGVPKNSLLLTGPNSTGKSYLMSALYHELRERGELAWYNRVLTMLQAVQAGYSGDSELKYNEVLNILSNLPYLFIDEMNMHHVTDDKKDIMEAVIDARCTHRLPTIIASNSDFDRIGAIWGNVVRVRLKHMAYGVEMKGAVMRDETGIIRADE